MCKIVKISSLSILSLMALVLVLSGCMQQESPDGISGVDNSKALYERISSINPKSVYHETYSGTRTSLVAIITNSKNNVKAQRI